MNWQELSERRHLRVQARHFAEFLVKDESNWDEKRSETTRRPIFAVFELELVQKGSNKFRQTTLSTNSVLLTLFRLFQAYRLEQKIAIKRRTDRLKTTLTVKGFVI